MMLTSACPLGTHNQISGDRHDHKGAMKCFGGRGSLYSWVSAGRKKGEVSNVVGTATERKGVKASCRRQLPN